MDSATAPTMQDPHPRTECASVTYPSFRQKTIECESEIEPAVPSIAVERPGFLGGCQAIAVTSTVPTPSQPAQGVLGALAHPGIGVFQGAAERLDGAWIRQPAKRFSGS